jgi:hypothetical protein
LNSQLAVGPDGASRLFLWLKVVTIVSVVFTFGNALWAAWDQGITYDEYYHLEWPRRLLYDRIDERESAFRYDSKTPVLLPAVVTVNAMERLGIQDERMLRFGSRLTPIAYLAGCLVLAAFLTRLMRPGAEWIAVLLISLDPNMAAHASIATSDVAYALVVLLLAWVLARLGQSRSRDLAVGAVLGCAFAVKFTAVLLIPVALVITFWGRRGREALVGAAALVAAFCATTSVLYLLVGVGTPLGSLSFRTPILQDLAAAWSSLPLPFPRSILTGIDISKDHNDHVDWNGYIFGTMHPGGVWYYFAAHWLMKTPIALIAAMLAGLWAVRREWSQPTVRILAALFAIHLLYFSLIFSTQVGLRYALVCIPLACTLAAVGLSGMTPKQAIWLIPLAAMAIAERTPYWGDPIAFTNLSVWPKSRAYWYTADSNLDYGQNRTRLARYVKASGLAAVVDQATVTPGLYVVSANNLTQFGNFRTHRWLIERNIPAINFGFTDFGFSITGPTFEAFMDETRTVPTLASFEEACEGGELPHFAPGDKVPFVRNDHPDGGRLWIVCVRSRKGIDLGLTVLQGRVLFGRVAVEGFCATELLQANQSAWYRVPRGGSAQLCIREIPFRRTSLPYAVDAYLTVRGQGADVEVREVPVGRLVTQYGKEPVP